MNDSLPTALETLGAQLDEAWDRRYGRQARRGRAVAWALRNAVRLVVPVVAILVGAALLTQTTGPGGVEQALASLGQTPTETIVHFTSVARGPDGLVTSRTEMWAATSPPYAERSILTGTDNLPIEQGASGDEVTQWDPSGTVYVRTKPGGIAEGNKPAEFAPNAAEIRAYLQSTSARDEGEVQSAGKTVRRFTMTPRGGGQCTYDVDPATFYAVAFQCVGLPDGSIDEQWSYIPRPGHEALLSVLSQHPAARIDRGALTECEPGQHTASTPPCVVDSPGA